MPVSESVKRNACGVYSLIAEAESHAHGLPVEEIHFHEVGTLDAIADVVGFCVLMELISPERVVCSPVALGSGQVRCAHGILPVPAPATAYIVRGMPVYAGDIECELLTPTGAALIKRFADEFANMPVMRIERTGYGMGRKDLPRANCVRAFLGETEDGRGSVCELVCDIDDMTAERIGFAAETILREGALDVHTHAVQMKKSRPGTELLVLCRAEDRERMTELIFRHTTTLGVRERLCRRCTMERRTESFETELGPVRVKTASGHGAARRKLEYDDVARIASERGISFDEAAELAERAIPERL